MILLDLSPLLYLLWTCSRSTNKVHGAEKRSSGMGLKACGQNAVGILKERLGSPQVSPSFKSGKYDVHILVSSLWPKMYLHWHTLAPAADSKIAFLFAARSNTMTSGKSVTAEPHSSLASMLHSSWRDSHHIGRIDVWLRAQCMLYKRGFPLTA